MSSTHVREQERYAISHVRLALYSLREIGHHLGRSYSTMSREITRCCPRYGDDALWW